MRGSGTIGRVARKVYSRSRGSMRRTALFVMLLTMIVSIVQLAYHPSAKAAALTVASGVSETQQTTSSTSYTASDTTIASGSLPAGTYLVLWGAAVANNNNAEMTRARLVRGATEIAQLGSESNAPSAANNGRTATGYWMGTLSGSEALTIEYNVSLNTTTGYIDSKFIKAIRLDTNLLEDADYWTTGSQESSSDESTNLATGAWNTVKTLTKTFDARTTQDYIVLASMEISPDSTSNDCMAQMVVDGTAVSAQTQEGEDSADQYGYVVADKRSIGSGSKSISLQGQSVGGSSCDYRRSRIYVLRANVFDQVQENESTGESTLASGTFTTKTTQAYTPNQNETVMVVYNWMGGSNTITDAVTTRINNSTDTLNYADTMSHAVNNTTADYYTGMSAASLTFSTAKTFNGQYARTSGSGTVKIKEAHLIVWSMTIQDPTFNQSAYRWYTNGEPNDWYDGAWTARRKITFNNAASSENLTDFPVRVSLTSSNIDYAKTQGAGQDIRFTDSDGTTLLAHEIEEWNESGTSEVWVMVPQIDSGSTTDNIYMYYGNSGVSDGQSAAAVWNSDYMGVWHLEETTGTNIDESNNGLDGTKVSSTEPNPTAGQVSGAQNFDGTNDGVNVGTNVAMDVSDNTLTLSAWIKRDVNSEEGYFMMRGSTGADVDGYSFGVGSLAGSGCTSTQITATKHGVGILCVGTLPGDTNWHKVAVVHSAAGAQAYVDGAASGASSGNSTNFVSAGTEDDFRIGVRSNGTLDPFDGNIDEVRVSSTARSADWIEAEYLTETNAMNSFGSEETNPNDWTNAAWTARRKITFNNAASSENLTDFPVRVSLTSSNIDYAKTQSAGEDLRFTDSDGTTLLKHEIETWNESGTSEVWVKVPQINSGSTTDFIWMYYGNNSASDGQDVANTWNSNYSIVYHMDDSGATLADSAGTAQNATKDGSSNPALSSGGKINGVQDFNGTTDGTYTSSPGLPTTDFTYETWFKLDSTSGDPAIFEALNSSQQDMIRLDIQSTEIDFYVNDTHFDSGSNVSTATWYNVTLTRSGSTIRFFLNGVEPGGTFSEATTLDFTGCGLHLGRDSDSGCNGSIGNWLDGMIDEFRVSTTARSVEWVEASYITQNNAMNSFGAEEQPSIVTPLTSSDNLSLGISSTSNNDFRLRLALHLTDTNLQPHNATLKLQTAARSGTCDTAFVGETYADVSQGSGALRYKDNTGMTDGTALATITDPIHGSDTSVAQTYEESNNFVAAASTAPGEDAVWEFALTNNSITWNTSYCLRAVLSTGTQLTTYTVVPEVASCVGPPTTASMRHGKAHCSSVNKRYFYW